MENKQKRLTEERLPPYLSYKSWQKLLSDLAVSTPERFDSSYFDTMDITKSNRSMLKGALLFLGLMNGDAHPTPRLHKLVKSENEARRAVLSDMVRTAYAPLFTDMDLSHATQAQVKEYFYAQGASGDIGRKCLSFFFAVASDASIQLSPHLKKSASKGRGKKVKSEDTPRARISKLLGPNEEIAWEKMLLEKFPNFSPEWSDDIKKKWFDAFKFLKKTLETSVVRKRTPTRRR